MPRKIGQKDLFPIIDFAQPLVQIQELLHQSLQQYGFLMLRNSPIDTFKLRASFELSEAFFACSLDEKSKYLYKSYDQKRYSNVGYFPFQSEKAVGGRFPDLKEFFHIGPSDFSSQESQRDYAVNVWPQFDPQFQLVFQSLFSQFAQTGNQICNILAGQFGIDSSKMSQLIQDGGHVLRIIHYPPVERSSQGQRAAQHTGIQLLGLQPVPQQPGLEYLTPAQEWVELDYEAFHDCILINIGDMFEYITGGKIKASPHRVTNRNLHLDRYATVFFYHANHSQSLQGFHHPIREELTAGQWLHKRLKDLSLMQ
ncbi:MAG: 2-oxoglutarate and iron-dependent oxygenase domain-containing protein [Bdellovibrionota bacterium]